MFPSRVSRESCKLLARSCERLREVARSCENMREHARTCEKLARKLRELARSRNPGEESLPSRNSRVDNFHLFLFLISTDLRPRGSNSLFRNPRSPRSEDVCRGRHCRSARRIYCCRALRRPRRAFRQYQHARGTSRAGAVPSQI